MSSRRRARPTAIGDFTKKVLAEHKSDYEEYKAANPEKGAHLMFVSEYKNAHKEEWAAFKDAWAAFEDAWDAAEAEYEAELEAEVEAMIQAGIQAVIQAVI